MPPDPLRLRCSLLSEKTAFKERIEINMNEKTEQIYMRVTPQEKNRIIANAEKCKLSVSEYIRQRCLGFAPREVPPQAYYDMCSMLEDALVFPEGEKMIPGILKELRETILLPGRDM